MKSRILLYLLISNFCLAAQNPSQKTEINSAFVSPILTIPYNGIITAPTPAQAKDNLLWYRGKKVNDSILITTDAKLVLYSSKRNMVVVQPQAKKDPSLKILKELANTQKRKDEYYNKMAERKNSVMMYPAIVNTLTEFDMILKKFEEMLKNFITLLPVTNTAANYQQNNTGLANVRFAYSAGIPQYLKNAYNKVLADKKNYPSIDFPPPPSKEFGACYNCDTSLASKQNSIEQRWEIEFSLYEKQIITRSMSIIKSFTDLSLENDAESLQMITELNKAMEFAWTRMDSKVDLLIRKYGNDFTKLSSVIQVAISFERQKQLLGLGNDASYAKTMEKLIPLFNGFDKYLDQQIAARNYDVVLNMAFIIGIERQRQLLGASEENNMPHLIEKINAFNRFKLDVQIDYEGQWDGCGIEKANFTATNLEEGFVQLGLVNCKYNFFLAEEYYKNSPYPVHYGNSYQIPLKVTNGTGTESQSSEDGERCWQIKHDLKGLTIRPYEPIASISFCEKNTDDSLQFYSLHLPVSHENREDIRYDYAKFKHFDTRMQNDGFDSGDIPSDIVEMAIEMEEIKGKFRQNEMKPNTNPSLAQMEAHHFEANRVKWLKAKINEYEERSNPSVIVFDAKNGAEIIIDEKTNKSYRDEDEKADVVIKVKITHAPLPYKKM